MTRRVALQIGDLRARSARRWWIERVLRERARQAVVDSEKISVRNGIAPANVGPFGLGALEGSLDGRGKTRAKECVEDGDGQRAARTENAFDGKAHGKLETFRTGVDLRGEKFIHAEQIENGVSDAEGAAELLASAGERDALPAFFAKMHDDVGRVSSLVCSDLDIFLLQRLEIASSCEAGETGFERVLVKRLAFGEANAATKVAIGEALVAGEIDVADDVGRRGVEIKFNRSDVRRGIKGRCGAKAISSLPFLALHVSMKAELPVSAERVDSMFGEVAARSDVGRELAGFLCGMQLLLEERA